MIPFTLEQAAKAAGGELKNCRDSLVTDVVIDDRKVTPGALFVAIKGERLDGHAFISRAISQGACCALSQRDIPDMPHIRVKDTTRAFQDIANLQRRLWGGKVIGVTGSVGKTTTKEMLSAVLSTRFCVLKSQGNQNNQTGVPLTLMGLRPEHEAAVVEMGTNHFGEIQSLSRTAEPDICLFTCIGTAHLENLGSREGILKAKLEMLDHMRAGGRVVACGDDELLGTLKAARRDVTTYGLNSNNDLYAAEVSAEGLMGVRFVICGRERRFPVFLPAPGMHMVKNALAAAAVGMELGLTDDEIARGVAAYEPFWGRMCIERHGGITVLNDVYNANPDSVRAALDNLKYAPGRRVCVLGDMLELGENAPLMHREIGSDVAKASELLLAVGPLSKNTAEGCSVAGGEALHYQTREDLIKALPGLLRTGDTVLVKASRSVALEKVVEAIRELTR